MPSASTASAEASSTRHRVFVVVARAAGVGGAEELERHGGRKRRASVQEAASIREIVPWIGSAALRARRIVGRRARSHQPARSSGGRGAPASGDDAQVARRAAGRRHSAPRGASRARARPRRPAPRAARGAAARRSGARVVGDGCVSSARHRAAFVRQPAGEQLEQHHAQRIEVAAAVDARAGELLGRHEGRRAEHQRRCACGSTSARRATPKSVTFTVSAAGPPSRWPA